MSEQSRWELEKSWKFSRMNSNLYLKSKIGILYLNPLWSSIPTNQIIIKFSRKKDIASLWVHGTEIQSSNESLDQITTKNFMNSKKLSRLIHSPSQVHSTMKFKFTKSKFILSNLIILESLVQRAQTLTKIFLLHHIYKIQTIHGFKIQVLHRKETKW